MAATIRECRHTVFACLFSAALSLAARADEQELPVVRATSTRVDVNDGGRMMRGLWNISPETALDVYYARRATSERRITFRTDVDSISFDVKPGQRYDFAVLLKGTRCCHTRISTLREVARLDRTDGPAGEDTIPFSLGRDGKIHVIGRFNGSAPLDLLLDLGADSVVLFPSGLAKGVKLHIDGSIQNLGTGGITTRQTSNDNRIAMGRLRWDHESVLLIEKQADRADAIVGYNLFDGKVIAFDYDLQRLQVTDRVAESAGMWAKLPVEFRGSLPGVTARFDTGAGSFTEWMALDTGSNLSAFLDRDSARRNGVYGSMRHLGTSEMTGVGSGSVRNEVVLLPRMTVGGLTLLEMPLHVEKEGGEGGGLAGHLGMDVLKRFNAVVDLRRDLLHLSPSTLVSTSYSAVGGIHGGWIAAAIGGLLLVGVLLWRRRRLKSAAKSSSISI